MADPPPAPADNPYQAGADAVRKTATWLAGVLGAAAGLMLAGVQLTSLGKLGDDQRGRLIGGIIALAVAVGATAWIISKLIEVMLPLESTITNVKKAADPADSDLRNTIGDDATILAGRSSIHELLDDYAIALKAQRDCVERQRVATRALADAASTNTGKPAREAALAKANADRQLADDGVAVLRVPAMRVIQLAGYLHIKQNFNKAKAPIFGAAIAAAICITFFAWAANPPEKKAAAEDALAPSPVSAVLTLNDKGQADLAASLGTDCAVAATHGLAVIALSSDKRSVEVIVVPSVACPNPVTLTVSTSQGSVVSKSVLSLPTPSSSASPSAQATP
jgi:hypothetical protein